MRTVRSSGEWSRALKESESSEARARSSAAGPPLKAGQAPPSQKSGVVLRGRASTARAPAHEWARGAQAKCARVPCRMRARNAQNAHDRRLCGQRRPRAWGAAPGKFGNRGRALRAAALWGALPCCVDGGLEVVRVCTRDVRCSIGWSVGGDSVIWVVWDKKLAVGLNVSGLGLIHVKIVAGDVLLHGDSFKLHA
jgi:hypothetical protein